MPKNNIRYLVNAATEQELCAHLKECSVDFNPPLAERVHIEEYSKKLFEKSVLFEAWVGNIIVGLIAAYFNDSLGRCAFITSVSVLKSFTGLGIASELLKMCIAHARQNDYKEINLEVSGASGQAIRLYKKYDFVNCGCRGDALLMKLDLAL